MEARTVVSAGSIAPRAYASEEAEEGQDQLQFDLYNLLALDHQAVGACFCIQSTDREEI